MAEVVEVQGHLEERQRELRALSPGAVVEGEQRVRRGQTRCALLVQLRRGRARLRAGLLMVVEERALGVASDCRVCRGRIRRRRVQLGEEAQRAVEVVWSEPVLVELRMAGEEVRVVLSRGGLEVLVRGREAGVEAQRELRKVVAVEGRAGRSLGLAVHVLAMLVVEVRVRTAFERKVAAWAASCQLAAVASASCLYSRLPTTAASP